MKMFFSLALLSLSLMAVGCESSKVATSTDDGGVASSSLYVSETEPIGAMPVGEAREKAADGQEVTLVGLIGGSSEPFVDGLAAFTIVDEKVPHCAVDEGCPTPWDYCCESNSVKDNIATVKIVDESGKPVTQDARKILSVKELSTVVVHGIAKRDDQGNLTVAVNEVFVRPEKK